MATTKKADTGQILPPKTGSFTRKIKKDSDKHVVPPATFSEITESIGITDEEMRRVRRVLSKRGYLK